MASSGIPSPNLPAATNTSSSTSQAQPPPYRRPPTLEHWASQLRVIEEQRRRRIEAEKMSDDVQNEAQMIKLQQGLTHLLQRYAGRAQE